VEILKGLESKYKPDLSSLADLLREVVAAQVLPSCSQLFATVHILARRDLGTLGLFCSNQGIKVRMVLFGNG